MYAKLLKGSGDGDEKVPIHGRVQNTVGESIHRRRVGLKAMIYDLHVKVGELTGERDSLRAGSSTEAGEC